MLVWDGEGAIGRWRGGRSELTTECQGLRGTLGAKVLICRPADPEAKGLIERAHDYLERSFLPGRTFASPAEFNAQLTDWLAVANTRRRRASACASADRITADRQAMLALPPVCPATGWRASTRLPRDHYIRLDSNDYSVHPSVIGRRIEVIADWPGSARSATASLSPTTSGSGRGTKRSPTPEHVTAAKVLRRHRIGMLRPAPEPQVEQRCLADYDTALGVTSVDQFDESVGEGGVA